MHADFEAILEQIAAERLVDQLFARDEVRGRTKARLELETRTTLDVWVAAQGLDVVCDGRAPTL